MRRLIIIALAISAVSPAFAQTAPGFDPVAPFFKPIANFQGAVNRTTGDSFTVLGTNNTPVSPDPGIKAAGQTAVGLTNTILGPIK